LGLGVVGLSSLEVLAHAAYDAGAGDEVVAVVDARRSEVFAGRFGPLDPSGRPVVVEPPGLFTPDDLAARLAGDGTQRLLVGDGARRYAERWPADGTVTVAGPSLAGPPPASLVSLGARYLAAGGAALDPADVHPRYLRPADARINWVTRQPAKTGP
jgi:tRNA A37 threonylcarbamoyladenosine modification protein TsaB